MPPCRRRCRGPFWCWAIRFRLRTTFRAHRAGCICWARVWPKCGRRAGLSTPAVSGATTADGLARLPVLLARDKPVLVIIELGANDGLRGLPLIEIERNLQRMIVRSREAGAKVLLLGIELPVNYGPQYRAGLQAIYARLAQRYRLPLVPFLLAKVALQPGLMQDDGLHPRAAGEPLVLDTVWPVLQPLLGQLPR